jgi:hypothetical protein
MGRPSSDASAVSLGRRVAEAHGATADGATVRLHFSGGGPVFRFKGQGDAFADTRADIQIGRQRVRFDAPDWSADVGGRELIDRNKGLRRGRSRFRWTRDDAATFAAAAMWTYTNVPYLLGGHRLRVTDGGRHSERGQTWQRLDLEFPDDIATHSPRQSLYVDADGLIRRHDYVARAVGSWARSAHYLEDYKEFGGIVLATRRHVHPRLPGRRAVRRPTVVHIDVHDAELVQPPPPAAGNGRRREPPRARRTAQ